MQFLKDISSLFYPKVCISCKQLLLTNETLICTTCRHDLPIICYKDFKKNNITSIFYGKIPIENANSFLLFQKEGKVKALIHELKYKGNQKVGNFLGDWLGHLLLEKNVFKDVDIIIPVPLHKKKLQKRGYNQLTTFGKKLGEVLKISYEEEILLRPLWTKTQTFQTKAERFSNLEKTFKISNSTKIQNKHILLIDDVITTGATLEACAMELLKTSGVKISILTMAFTE
ncbi:MAG: ComF family protein [Flavobacteriaceae bacterium]